MRIINNPVILVMILLLAGGAQQLVTGAEISSVNELKSRTFISGPNKVPVVELYTSEGCSSCPPADKFLGSIESHIDSGHQVLPLAFHVDYWNSLGWRDPFSKAEYTERQRRMARINRQSTIYTPEFLVDGQEVRGTRRVLKKVNQGNVAETRADIRLTLKYSNNKAIEALVLIDNIINSDDTAELYLAIYENNLERSITAGENRGRTLSHNYVVRHWQGPIAVANGFEHPYKLDLNPSWKREELNLAIIVKEMNSGQTLQALAVKL